MLICCLFWNFCVQTAIHLQEYTQTLFFTPQYLERQSNQPQKRDGKSNTTYHLKYKLLWCLHVQVSLIQAHVSSIHLCHTYGGSRTAWQLLASMRSILFVSLWASVEKLTGKSFLFMVSSDTIPFLQSHIMPVFTMQVETVIGRII